MPATWDYDVFISYAHEDNQPVPPEIDGWVDQFEKTLTAYLGRTAGDPPKIWRDPVLERSADLNAKLREHLTRSATLLCILSRSYIRSKYCLAELQQFLAEFGDHERVFKVVTATLPNEREHPAPLDNHIGYPFFQIDENNHKAYELDLTDDRSVRVYRRLTYDLARDMAQRIEALRNQTPAPASLGTVYLARTGYDLTEKRAAICGELESNGFTVLPKLALPDTEAECETAVRDYIAQCCLSVHLVGQFGGGIPDGPGSETYAALQYRIAAESAAQPGSKLFRLVWMPPGLQPKVPEQTDFVAKLAAASWSPANRADLVQGSLEDFRALTLAKAQQAVAPPPPTPDAQPSTRRVYLIYDPADDPVISPVDEGLAARGSTVRLPVFDGDEKARDQDHRDALLEADLIVLYWGAATELWLNSHLGFIRKSQGYGRPNPPKIALLIAPPPGSRKQRWLRQPQAELAIPVEPGKEAAALDALCQAVFGKAAAGGN